MLQKGCYSAKIKSAKVYTLEIYPLYGKFITEVRFLSTDFQFLFLLLTIYRRIFCKDQTYANFDRFAKNCTARTQKLDSKVSNFLLIWLIRNGFLPAKYSYSRGTLLQVQSMLQLLSVVNWPVYTL